MSKIVPLISSGTAGPLGVLHLPRLWQKVSLEAAGRIADGYPGIGAGYDSMVINGLGLDAEAVRSFITDSKPTYPRFEAWIREQPGATLDAGKVLGLMIYNSEGARKWRDKGARFISVPFESIMTSAMTKFLEESKQ